MKKRIIKDGILNGLTYLFSSLGVLILLLIIIFIFSKGFKIISLDLIRGDYYSESYTLKYIKEYEGDFQYECNTNEYFSKNWGVAFIDAKNLEGENVVQISYIDKNSPLLEMIDASTNTYVSVQVSQQINKGVLQGKNDSIITIGSKDIAEKVANKFDKAILITNLSLTKDGGGIRGSLIATFLLIILTLLISLPLGICAAIYLSIYAKENKFKEILESMIDMTGGVP